MQIVVMGAGAVGCYYGALLARAGHDVTLVGRPSHVAAMRERGLLLETKAGSEHIRVTAATDASDVSRPDLVLVSVKSSDTEDAGRALADRLAPDTTILCLQNGVDNAERLAAVLGRPVLSAVVYVGAEMAGPGHVRHHGRGELVIGASSASAALARALSEAGIPTTVSDDIAAALWSKLIVNCAYNALSAVGGIAYGPMLEVPGTRDLMIRVIDECTAVAAAAGVRVPADIRERTLAIGPAMPSQFSSTAQDLMRDKPTEIDHLNGYVVRKGRDVGIDTPANAALWVMVKLAEAGRAGNRVAG
jgi:2-dehydropantoate 2-reductase